MNTGTYQSLVEMIAGYITTTSQCTYNCSLQFAENGKSGAFMAWHRRLP